MLMLSRATSLTGGSTTVIFCQFHCLVHIYILVMLLFVVMVLQFFAYLVKDVQFIVQFHCQDVLLFFIVGCTATA